MITRSLIRMLSLVLFLFAAVSGSSTDPSSVLIGVWYFGGWFNCSPVPCYSHFHGFTPLGEAVDDFFTAYPERLPLLGKYSNAVTTITAEVAAAESAGIDFFHVLFYDDDGEQLCGPNPDPNLSPCLDVTLALMLNTSSVWEGSSGRLHFALSYSNDVDRARVGQFVGDAGRDAWLSRVGTWVRAMAHPQYLIIGGRPLFQILIPDIFLNVQCSGNVTLAAALLDMLREAGRDAGIGAPVIGGGWQNPALPPAQAPRAHPEGYMLYSQTDISCSSCDIGRAAAQTPGVCMATCNTTAGCVAFVWYGSNETCALKNSAGPGVQGGGDTYVRVADQLAWEWRGTYNDAVPLCYAGENHTDPGQCPQYADSWLPNATAAGGKIFPYSDVLKFQADARGNQSGDATPYLPNVIAGFDPRPWEEAAPAFTDPTIEEWTAALSQVRDLVTDPENRKFGIPDSSAPGGIRPCINIYAWNEFGEGGILAPTAGDGFMKLQVLSTVFARGVRSNISA